jgi:hypothetical protein
MPGSGKTLVADAMAKHGFYNVGLSQYVGDAPRADADSLQATRVRWRQSIEARKAGGAAAVVERAWAGLEHEPPQQLVFDGVRSLYECAFLATHTDLTVAVFQRGARLRHSRLRAGPNAAYRTDPSALLELDAHEICLGVGAVIAIADIVYFSHATEVALADDTARAAAAISEALLQDNRGDDGGCRPDYAALQALITA